MVVEAEMKQEAKAEVEMVETAAEAVLEVKEVQIHHKGTVITVAEKVILRMIVERLRK